MPTCSWARPRLARMRRGAVTSGAGPRQSSPPETLASPYHWRIMQNVLIAEVLRGARHLRCLRRTAWPRCGGGLRSASEQRSMLTRRTMLQGREANRVDLWCWRRRRTARVRCQRQKKTIKSTWCMLEAEFVRPLLSDREKLTKAVGKVRARWRKLEAAHGARRCSMGPTSPPSLHQWTLLLPPRPDRWRGTRQASWRRLMLRAAISRK